MAITHAYLLFSADSITLVTGSNEVVAGAMIKMILLMLMIMMVAMMMMLMRYVPTCWLMLFIIANEKLSNDLTAGCLT